MSKMSELAMQTEKEEIAYLNSLSDDEKEDIVQLLWI
jgi:hypothetical protein